MLRGLKAVAGTRRRGLAGAAVALATCAAIGVSATPASAVTSVRAQEWFLTAMQAQNMWRTSTGKGITVAVIDDGVNGNHPDLRGQVLTGKDFTGLQGGPWTEVPGVDHGTSMASLIAATGKGLHGQGAMGLAPGAKILPLRVNDGSFGSNAATQDTVFQHQLAQAIRYAADHGAQIANMSLGTELDPSAELTQAVQYAQSKGVLLVAAVGNDAEKGNPADYPAALPGVLGVAAVDKQGKPAAFSEHGPWVAVSAPGVDIATACVSSSTYCKGDGTSEASAIVSGAAALVWAAHRDWTADQVMRVLLNTAGSSTPGKRDDYVGYGAVRPRIALTNPGNPGPADVNPLIPASASASAAPSSASAAPSTDSSPVAASGASSGSSSTGLWIGVGVGAVVVIGAIVGGVLLAGRRRRTASAGPSAVPYGAQPFPQPGQQPYQPPASMPGGISQNPYQAPYGQNPQAGPPSSGAGTGYQPPRDGV